MPRTQKGTASPKVFDELSPSAKRRVRKMQQENGFRGIDRLTEIINTDREKQGLPKRGRTTVGSVNEYLREVDKRRKDMLDWGRQLAVSPEEFSATAIVGIAVGMHQLFDSLEQLAQLPTEIDIEKITARIHAQQAIARAYRDLSQALKGFKSDARIDGVSFKDAVEDTANSVDTIAQSNGLPPEIVAEVRAKIMGIKRVISHVNSK